MNNGRATAGNRQKTVGYVGNVSDKNGNIRLMTIAVRRAALPGENVVRRVSDSRCEQQALPSTCRITITRHRVFVRWHTPDPAVWRMLFLDFRRVLPRHRDAFFLRGMRAFSVPRRHLETVEEWAAAHYAPENIFIRHEDSTGAEPTAIFQVGSPEEPAPQAGVPAAPSDELALVQARRAERIAVLRHLPDHSAEMTRMKRLIADDDEIIGLCLTERQRSEEA